MKQHGMLDMGERYALQKKGNDIVLPIAKTAARVAFEACGGDRACKSWTMVSGTMRKIAYKFMETYLGENPDASAEALYDYIMNYPAGATAPPDERAGRIFSKAPMPWAEAPAPARAGYEAFHGVYRQLWQVLQDNDASMAQALAWRRPPRLVKLPRYLPQLSEADVADLQDRLARLGYSECEIKYRLTDPCFTHNSRDRILWDAEEMACYRVFANEEARKHGGEVLIRQPEPGPDRPYLQAIYEDWKAYWSATPRNVTSWVHTGMPSGRG